MSSVTGSLEWEEKYSERFSRNYYYNARTRVSVWDDPRDKSSSESSSLIKTSTNDSDVPAVKRARVDDENYVPPVSGSAADAVILKSQNLPAPLITADLGPCPGGEDMWSRTDIQVNQYLAETYKSGNIVDSNGELKKFKDITNPIQGRHIYNLIFQNKYQHTLEVGLAMGASAVWICQAHKNLGLNGTHVAVDPNQTSQYEGMGRTLVQRSGLSAHLSVMEMTSYRALPLLLEEVLSGRRPRFHLIYIDGWHTFDYTLVDFFYADLLLEPNGVIVLDDIKHKPVQKCLKYIVNNYPHYNLVPRTPCYNPGDPKVSSQATFIKKEEDSRVWNHHVDF